MFSINPTGCATSNQEAVISAKVMDMGKKRIEGKMKQKNLQENGVTILMPKNSNCSNLFSKLSSPATILNLGLQSIGAHIFRR